MVTSAVVLAFAWLFSCLSGWFAYKSGVSHRESQALTRLLRSQVADLELVAIRNEASIKRLTGQYGSLSRSPSRIQDVKLPGELPDPKVDPEAWRSAVRKLNSKTLKPN